ncbi:MAG: hypothetical protein IJ410_09650 [Oscillospiraceae bacterium]|nr:hypothetical protein [Oscillospiraceae bacterium]MBQ8605089.1 hypothetical protein [Oscillospiraceae bacterium]
MKKIFSVILSVIVLCSLFSGCAGGAVQQSSSQPESKATPAESRKQPIEWKDETVKKMVYDCLMKDYSEDVYPSELEKVTSLYILADKRMSFNGRPYEDIEPEKPYEIRYSGTMKTDNGYEHVTATFTEMVPLCLDDLEYFTNLEELYIHLVNVEDLSFASRLPQLKALGMGCCDIDNLNGIEGCSNLRTLYMPYNKISDISPLSGLNLWDLFLQHNNISDISPLADMESIPDELVLSYNNITDISALKGGAFNYLNLRNNNISDISPLAECKGIPILSLTYNNISDVSPLEHLPKDCTIYLRGNPVENKEVLKDFSKVYMD